MRAIEALVAAKQVDVSDVMSGCYKLRVDLPVPSGRDDVHADRLTGCCKQGKGELISAA